VGKFQCETSLNFPGTFDYKQDTPSSPVPGCAGLTVPVGCSAAVVLHHGDSCVAERAVLGSMAKLVESQWGLRR